jgi:hypothetical protein
MHGIAMKMTYMMMPNQDRDQTDKAITPTNVKTHRAITALSSALLGPGWLMRLS